MEFQEFQDWIANKLFRSTDGMEYRFISGTTLEANGNIANSVQYKLYQDEQGSILLDHKGIVPNKLNEPLRIEINNQLNPYSAMSFAIHGSISNDFLGTWIEVQSWND